MKKEYLSFLDELIKIVKGKIYLSGIKEEYDLNKRYVVNKEREKKTQLEEKLIELKSVMLDEKELLNGLDIFDFEIENVFRVVSTKLKQDIHKYRSLLQENKLIEACIEKENKTNELLACQINEKECNIAAKINELEEHYASLCCFSEQHNVVKILDDFLWILEEITLQFKELIRSIIPEAIAMLKDNLSKEDLYDLQSHLLLIASLIKLHYRIYEKLNKNLIVGDTKLLVKDYLCSFYFLISAINEDKVLSDDLINDTSLYLENTLYVLDINDLNIDLRLFRNNESMIRNRGIVKKVN